MLANVDKPIGARFVVRCNIACYLRQDEGYLISAVCLSVVLSVILSVSRITTNVISRFQ